MRLFLTVSPPPTTSGAAAEAVPLFDDGVWSRSGPSEDAITTASAAFVAREMHRQAALTKLLRTCTGDILCFRYGPRPSPAHDVFFFHRASLHTATTSKSPSARPPPSGESTGMSSPLVTPSTSLSSVRSARSLLLSPLDRSTGHLLASPPLAVHFDSLVALWLLESVATPEVQHVAVTACLFFVDGGVVDLATRQELYAPLHLQTGTVRRLRSAEDVHAYLAHCEQSAHDTARRRNRRTPHHLWITARIVAGGEADSGPAVTFLDVAFPMDAAGEDTGDRDGVARVREQLRLFRRQFDVAAASTGAPPQLLPSPQGAHATADRRWLGLLQSCQLSLAATVGVFALAAGQSPFELAGRHVDGDPIAFSVELRQRALADAVNRGVLHPRPVAARHRRGRHGHHTVTLASPSSAQLATASLATPPTPSMRLPPLRHHTRPTATPQENALTAYSPAASERRHRDVAALLTAEEAAARSALCESEERARELMWLRWALRARPPESSTSAVARRLTAAARRVERTAVHSAPLKRPPPLQHADLAATVRVARVHRGSPSTAAERHASPETFPDLVPILTPAMFVSHAASSAASPSRRGSAAAASAASRSSVHPEFLVRVIASDSDDPRETEGRGRRSASNSPQASASTSRAASRRRRYSTLEVALLERAHSATRRSSPATSPRCGSEVELLYPLVRSFHAEVTAQDSAMAAEMMARSKIEMREMNRRRTLEKWMREKRAPSMASPAAGCASHGRRYSASPRASRAYFDA